jgi:hypothetical protein
VRIESWAILVGGAAIGVWTFFLTGNVFAPTIIGALASFVVYKMERDE